SPHTASTYKNAVSFYLETLRINKIDPDNAPITSLSEDTIVMLATALKNHAATTERLYLTAVTGFFAYLAADNLTEVNLPRIKLLIQQRARKPGQRLPQFPSSDIDSILNLIDKPEFLNSEDEQDHLIKLRDRAFLMTLADTGLRVHEACNLRRGDLDWNEGKAMIIGKGNRQAIIRFSTRSTNALKDYLKIRTTIDGGSKTPLSALPLFARHDRGAGKKVKPMTTTTGRNIVTDRVRELLGDEAVGTITPHSFRHYFVTRVLRASGNLKLAQELARHTNIAVTQRYAHLSDDELDRGYWDAIEG
ncbi:MAG: tyrosine-type recombinase/integrase, partial [Anaerolineaceae bacterium]|nr:tyrosine-type recombinase/integrase [Anaerolineaceae bacterium]